VHIRAICYVLIRWFGIAKCKNDDKLAKTDVGQTYGVMIKNGELSKKMSDCIKF